jgi:hypothetical protein
VASDSDLFAGFDAVKQRAKGVLGFKGADFEHGRPPETTSLV